MEEDDSRDLQGDVLPLSSHYSDEDDVDDPDIIPINSPKQVDPNPSTINDKSTVVASTSSSLVCSNAVEPIIPPTYSGITIKLHNVVASVNLNCKLDLMKISLRTRNSEYNPRRFHALVMRIWNPRTAALIFRSGKVIVTGGRSESGVHLAARKYARILQKLGYKVHFSGFKIQNMVASCDVRFPIMLERLYTNQVQFSNYEPELFPGVIYRMIEPRVVLLIFVSGKMVLTGGKNRGELSRAFENIYPILRSFRKQ